MNISPRRLSAALAIVGALLLGAMTAHATSCADEYDTCSAAVTTLMENCASSTQTIHQKIGAAALDCLDP